MAVQHFIVATAGHIDHGKSSLVRALTGTDPDRLPEEKARGITIDLGFAHLELAGSAAADRSSRTFSCGIIDVPGHEDFVSNMVAGVGSIDLALLVVAADDRWMPQTEEHLQILLYLGVTRAVVALTKVDAAPDEAGAIESVRSKLAGTPFAEASIVPTSVVSGRGLDDLTAAMARELEAAQLPADLGKPRLWVDRVFTLKGLGTVVTGTLIGGYLARGDAVIVQPAGHRSRIRACQSHGLDADRVGPGTRVALNLPDLAATGDTAGGTTLRRGDVVTTEALGGPSTTLDVTLSKSGRLEGLAIPAARPLKDGTLLRLHLGSSAVPARVRLLRDSDLKAGGQVLAQLRLEQPIFAFAGDHFILRDGSQQATLAGGLILDPDAQRPRARSPERLSGLDACAVAGSNAEAFVFAAIQHGGLFRLDELLIRSRFARREVIAAVGRLVAANRAALAGPFVTPTEWWNPLVQAATDLVDTCHRQHPELPGLALSELRAALQSHHGLLVGFEEVIAVLVRSGFSTHGTIIRRSTHLPALPPSLAAAGQRIRNTLTLQPLDPPNRKELTPDTSSLQALRYLIQSGEVVEIGSEAVLSADAFASARDRIGAFLKQRGHASASDLRQLLGTSRRILIPLLEKLDREGVTVRDGDLRRLRA